VDVLRVPAVMAGKEVVVGLDSCCSENMMSKGAALGLQGCDSERSVDCLRDATPLVIRGVGGAVVVSNKEANVLVRFDNGVEVEKAFRLVEDGSILLPDTDALVNMAAIRELGLQVDKKGVGISGIALKEAPPIVHART
jgi:hypothetical protein